MNKDEFIIKAVLSLNNGDSGYYEERVKRAITQYNQLIEQGIEFEPKSRWIRPKPDEEYNSHKLSFLW